MESNIILFTAQWFTIQPDLFGRIEDEAGELGESEKEFIRICTTALNSGRFAKYRWCGKRRQEQPNRLRKICRASVARLENQAKYSKMRNIPMIHYNYPHPPTPAQI